MTPPPPRGARVRAKLTVERLRELYPAVTELAHKNAFELLIATILSAQTTDRSVNLVTPELFRRYTADFQEFLIPTIDVALQKRPSAGSGRPELVEGR